MAEDVFTDPDDPAAEWVDVRMSDPDQGEWDIDVIVAGGTVEYVDLRIKPELIEEFVDCLIDDVGEARAGQVLTDLADRNGIDIVENPDDT